MDIYSAVTKELVIDALKDVIGIQSVSLNEQELAQYLRDRLEKAGLAAQIDAHGNMVAKKEFGKPGKTFYFNSHMDTVEVSSQWTKNPLGEVVGDRFYGCGVCDCQASLTGMMLALELIAKSGVELSGTVGLAAVAREQWPNVSTKGTVNMIEDGFCADMVVIGEPTDLTICRGCEGMVELEINTFGVPVHGCNPEEGVNAIEVMHEIMTRIKRLPVGHSEILGSGALNFGVISGGFRTCVLPESCKLKISRFVVEGETGSQFLAEVEAILDEVRREYPRMRAEAHLNYDTRAGVVHDGAPVIEALKAASKKITGKNAPLTTMRAHMDADFLINMAKIPTVAFGPGDLSALNAGDEWIAIDDMVTAVKVYIAAVLSVMQ